MVSLKAIRAAHTSFSSKQRSLTAVFAGATSGIGLGAIEALLKNTKSSKIFIIGRSATKFSPTLAALQKLDPSAQITFREAQVSLLKDVDDVCTAIRSQAPSIDILWLSQGGLSSKAHHSTAEGIFDDYAVAYYSRILFMHKLLPLLKTGGGGRVVSVHAAGEEGPINSSQDFGLQNPANYASLGFWGSLKQGVTMTSLTMHELALQNPEVAFLHTFPGLVSTPVHEKWAKTMSGWLAPVSWLILWVAIPIRDLFALTSEQAGEIGFYEATNERFNSRDGQNFWRLDENAEPIGDKGRAVLEKYENDGTREKLWEDTLGVFQKVLGQ